MKAKLILFLVAMLPCGGLHAHPAVRKVLERMPETVIPFVRQKSGKISTFHYGIDNSDNLISNRLYMDLQLTDWHDVSKYDAERHIILCKFVIPGRNYCLLLANLGGVTDQSTDVLVSVTPDGEVLDQMDVAVMTLGEESWAPIMQFEITQEGKVIVYRLVPTDNTSVRFDMNTKPFEAYREDRTYDIDENGKFVLSGTKRYKPRTYSIESLSAPGYNIWNGNEEAI